MFLASFVYCILASYIQTEGVRKLLQELDPHKATGPDNIPANLLKLTAPQTAPSLVLVFTASVIQGKLPDDHINSIAAKATAAQAFLQRNTAFCPMELKTHCYSLSIQLWNILLLLGRSPHITLSISKLERV